MKITMLGKTQAFASSVTVSDIIAAMAPEYTGTGSHLFEVQGGGNLTVNDAVLDLAFIIEPSKCCGIRCAGHLLVNCLKCCKGSNLGHRNSACPGYLYRIIYDALLIFKSGIRHKGNIR